MQPNGFREVKTLTRTTPPKVLTAPKVLKKKKKKHKDEWNKSPEVSEDEDPSLQPKSLFNDPKRLQAAVTLAMKSGLTHRLIEILNFLVSPIYKLAIHDRIKFESDPPMQSIPHKVDDLWIEHVTANQPLPDPTYHGRWSMVWRLTTSMPLATLLTWPCSTMEYAFLNDMLVQHTQSLDSATCTTFYQCMWYPANGNPRLPLTQWMNRIPEREPAFHSDPGTYICN
uniref:Uncharacterized protein n=1 Tax=Romanomermis culicivorax TaxID=13658 RepID=A0A915IPM0_ROMCU